MTEQFGKGGNLNECLATVPHSILVAEDTVYGKVVADQAVTQGEDTQKKGGNPNDKIGVPPLFLVYCKIKYLFESEFFRNYPAIWLV